jgi:hypothetical protein
MFERQFLSKLFEVFEKATPENIAFLKEFLQVSNKIIDEVSEGTHAI